MQQASRWLLAVVTLALVGCGGSTLPSYGAPQGSVMSEEEFQGGDLIRYRLLTRDDFRGSAPTGPAAEHVDKVGAQTFTLVRHDPGVRFEGKETPLPNGKRRSVGTIKNLVFRAWMDRSRSWWNPKKSQTPEDYVLQHEQIHFALVELEAAVMNGEGAELMQRPFEGTEREDLQRQIEDAINEIVKDGMERLLETNRDFDEATSGRYDPKAQNEWWKRVQQKLAENERRAVASSK